MNARKLLVLAMLTSAALLLACGGGEPVEEPQADSHAAVETETEDVDVARPEMTEEDKLAYVMDNCICPGCPSWIPEAEEKGEGGYCATGVSECIVVESGCICGECPVSLEMGLEWGYYCTRGSVEEMMMAREHTEDTVPERR